ncbi:BQ2448_2220 [Microbotryum intermedium]|uniref:BQ2448_2220 protein n=1 Tax=Microbotryum intermedium TaxID=269621 RepID=A0A238F5J7_9BASI|nr:BQ2448_2220 [Microbotryum intermedium]
MFKSAFAPTMRVLSSKKMPLLTRTKDPLRSSVLAEHFILPSGSTFIVRPPPSVLPATIAVPSTSSQSTIHEQEHRLPLSRSSQTGQTRSQDPNISKKVLTTQEIEKLQALRRSDPARWTRSRLARKFGLASPTVVGMLGWGNGPEGKRAEKDRKLTLENKRMAAELKWGWKKTIAMEERRRRRAMW